MHASGSSGGQWRNLAAELAPGHRFLTPDLYGHGRSDFWPDPESLRHDHQANLVRRVIEHAAVEEIDLVGHSYGGATAIRFTLEYPECVGRLVLIEPMMACFLREADETAPLALLEGISNSFQETLAADGPEAAWRGFLDYRNGPGSWAGYTEETRANFIRRTPAQVANFHANANNRTRRADLAAIAKPTLVLRGEETTPYDRRMAEIAAEGVPECRYEILAKAAHMSPLTHPAEVAALIRAHLGAP